MNEPIELGSNQVHATITENGICPTLSASMGLGGGYVPMVVIEATYTEKRFFERQKDDVSVTLRNKSGSYGGGSEVLVIFCTNKPSDLCNMSITKALDSNMLKPTN